jgi:hypothetical protein
MTRHPNPRHSGMVRNFIVQSSMNASRGNFPHARFRGVRLSLDLPDPI